MQVIAFSLFVRGWNLCYERKIILFGPNSQILKFRVPNFERTQLPHFSEYWRNFGLKMTGKDRTMWFYIKLNFQKSSTLYLLWWNATYNGLLYLALSPNVKKPLCTDDRSFIQKYFLTPSVIHKLKEMFTKPSSEIAHVSEAYYSRDPNNHTVLNNHTGWNFPRKRLIIRCWLKVQAGILLDF